MITLSPQTWEHQLLSLAREARPAAAPSTYAPIADPAFLDRAYAYCEAITAENSKTFWCATQLMPTPKRRAVRALYAFCRVADNIVDGSEDEVTRSLAAWRARTLTSRPRADDLIATAWTDTRLRYRIPIRYAEQLLEGVARDLCQTRYQTFEDLTAYAYGVASTVGLMSMHIIGYTGAEAIPYAIKLGVALQLTNILRDVGEDWRAGRLYLPLDELNRFGLNEAAVACGRVDDRWRAFMRFEMDRNRRLYEQALPGVQLLHPDGRLAVQAAGELYRAILNDIEAQDYDVFNRRAHIGSWDKLRSLPGIWWRSHSVGAFNNVGAFNTDPERGSRGCPGGRCQG